MPDRILFRRWRQEPRTLIALMMDDSEGPGKVNSYEHVGQHGAADVGIVQETDPVPLNHPDALNLIRELRSLGYEPRQMLRMQRAI